MNKDFGTSRLEDTHVVLERRVTAGQLADFWNQWATQFLVILSLVQQLTLLVCSGIRRHQRRCSIRRALLWLAYQLAESTATYALGNLSLSSNQREHRLFAFWAPFLLLHLAGPDNITAYSLEDNNLWGRHLVTAGMQALGAGYVVYKRLAGNNGIFLSLVVTLLITVIPVFKLGEKTYALRCAKLKVIQKRVEAAARAEGAQRGKCHLYLENELPKGGFKGKEMEEEEFLMLRAHAVFRICESAMVNSREDPGGYVVGILRSFETSRMLLWTLMEMELSLMYDILYTKTRAVVHTVPGYCIRVISALAALASLLLFHVYGREGHTNSDVAITYVLLGGAVFMEMVSMLSAFCSTWTFSFLCATTWSGLRHAALCSHKWQWFRRRVLSLRRLAHRTRVAGFFMLSRRWSGTMGQYNKLVMCTARPRSWLSGILGYNHNMPDAITVPDDIKYFLLDYIRDMIVDHDHLNAMGMVRDKWGVEALRRWRRDNKDPDVDIPANCFGAELHEAIIIWHIATDIFLVRRHKTEAEDEHRMVRQVRALSNYMMFLLVEQPDMLPGLAQNKLLQWTDRSLATQWDDIISNGRSSGSGLHPSENLASALYEYDKQELLGPHVEKYRLSLAIKLARTLVDTKNALGLVNLMWADFLIYAANRCSRESHAKKLNSGGEFTTLVWLLTEHFHQVNMDRILHTSSQ